MQADANGRLRPISYQSRQLRKAERNYPVHDLELLAMKYALAKFRIYLLGSKPFVVYTDHASLRTAVNSPHISQRMARWLAFFAEYSFTVEYKPGRDNVLADALSRRPSTEILTANAVSAVATDLPARLKAAYAEDAFLQRIWLHLTTGATRPSRVPQIERYSIVDGLLVYRLAGSDSPRIYVPCDASLRSLLLSEHHDTAMAGHLGRDKTYLSLSRLFYWPRMYKAVDRYVRSCETCQLASNTGPITEPGRSHRIVGIGEP